MAATRIRVGLVGASIPRNGWAVRAHAPTLAELDEFALYAVATTRPETAQQAAEVLGAARWYTSALDLAEDPDVDLVVVGVGVSRHAPVVRAAIAAGKHLLCEWPLGVDLEEAEQLAGLPRQTGTVAAIGLQARYAPAVQHARALIADGFLGELQSATLSLVDPQLGGGELSDWLARYIRENSNTITVLNITGAHALDALCSCAGEVAHVSAEVATLTDTVTISDTGETEPWTVEDHVVLSGRLEGGALVAAQLLGGGGAGGSGATIDLHGSDGALRIATSHPTQLQLDTLRLLGGRESNDLTPIAIPAALTDPIPTALRGGGLENLAALYRSLGTAIRGGEAPAAADFETAVARHRLVDAVYRAGASGCREPTGSTVQSKP